MPFIKVSTGKEMTKEEIAVVYDILKDNIQLIGGKTVDNAMMQVEAGVNSFMHGEKGDYTFIDIRLMGKSPLEEKDAYAAAVCNGLCEKFGIALDHIYLNYTEKTGWGAGGRFRGE